MTSTLDFPWFLEPQLFTAIYSGLQARSWPLQMAFRTVLCSRELGTQASQTIPQICNVLWLLVSWMPFRIGVQREQRKSNILTREYKWKSNVGIGTSWRNFCFTCQKHIAAGIVPHVECSGREAEWCLSRVADCRPETVKRDELTFRCRQRVISPLHVNMKNLKDTGLFSCHLLQWLNCLQLVSADSFTAFASSTRCYFGRSLSADTETAKTAIDNCDLSGVT